LILIFFEPLATAQFYDWKTFVYLQFLIAITLSNSMAVHNFIVHQIPREFPLAATLFLF